MSLALPVRLGVILALLASLLVAAPTASSLASAGAGVFINEVNYDDVGTDTMEFIEVAGAAGTDTTGWSIVLYSGSTPTAATTYGSPSVLAGTLPDLDESGIGVAVVEYPTNGIQNGDADAIALLDPAGTVVEFLSYEGVVTASNGPAAGMVSTDIGVEDSNTDDGSLQRTADCDTWLGPIPPTRGGLNASQATDCDGGDGGDGGDGPATPAEDVFLNELHYDNDGADTGEFVEVAGPAGTDLAGWEVALYNGANGERYGTIALAGMLSGTIGDGIGVADFAQAGIQNGSPDGLALVDPSGVVVEFLSYEGVLTAVEGPANGFESTDIGVAEPSDTPIGESLQRTSDCSWTGPLAETRGAPNADQGSDCAVAPVAPPVEASLNEVRLNIDGPQVDFVEVAAAPGANVSNLSVVVLSGEFAPGQVDFALPLSGAVPESGLTVVDGVNFFGSPTTYLLVEGFTGSAGDDLDTDDDGTLDATPWTNVLDSVSFVDGDGTTDLNYSSTVLGPDGFFTPAHAYRCPDVDGEWVEGRFSDAGADTPGEPNACAPDPVEAFIHEVQGNGDTSPLVGLPVIVEAVVVGDFQDGVAGDQGDLNGFYIQEEDDDADGDPATSEGLFVFNGSDPTVNVAVGDLVRVTGVASEFGGQTQISAFGDDVVVVDTGVTLPTPTVLEMPFDTVDFPERFEGMRVAADQPLYVAEYFNLDRFGEMVLTQQASGLVTPTQVTEPGSPEYEDLLSFNLRSQITLDDGRTVQNPNPVPFVDPNLAEGTYDDNRRRGDRLDGLVGVLGEGFDRYRIQVDTDVVTTDSFTTTIERPESAPDVGGDVTVASLNVLNYFTSIGNDCGPSGNLECRGANNTEELERQTAKTVTALQEIDADVVGLIEIENDGDDSSVATLVAGLNDELGAGTYDYVATGFVGTDAIKQALIFKPGAVTPVGDPAILDTDEFVNGLQSTPKNRAALAQTFVDDEGGAVTVVVNHLKSKGSDCGPGDDATDGSGNCDGTRTRAAELLVDWIEDGANGFAEDVLVIGDLNSYAQERPIEVFLDAGYVNTVLEDDPDAYGYVFDAQQGTLDYALASSSLATQVTGSAEFGINADEADLIDYNTDFGRGTGYFNPDIPYRASDHDPVITGLELVPTAADAGGPYEVTVNGSVELDASASSDGSGLGLAYAWDLDGDGVFDDAAGETVLVEGPGGPPGPTTVAVEVTDAFGSTSVDEAELAVLANGRGNDGRPKGRFPANVR